jgi:hypothetical protein
VPERRTQCPVCGTDQEAPGGDAPALCEICGAPLSDGAVRVPIDLDELDGAPADEKRETLRELRTFEQMVNAPPSGAAEEIGKIRAATKRGDFLLSLVPVWGVWRLWRSEAYDDKQKVRWTLGSVAVTAGIIIGIAALLPGATERAQIAKARVEADFDGIAALVERYAKDTGRYPDSEVWNQTVERGDLRFLDPWNRHYRYRLEPDRFVLDTYGSDGQPGGTADDADLSRSVPRREAAIEEASQ